MMSVLGQADHIVAADGSRVTRVMLHRPERSRRSVQQVEPATHRRRPDMMIHILEEIFDTVVAETRFIPGAMYKMREPAGRIHPVQTAVIGSRPEMPLAVHQQTQDDIAAQAMRIGGIMPEMLPPLRPAVKTVDTTTPGPYPEIALGVFDNALHQVIGQTIVIPCLVLVNGKGIPIIPVQPLARPEPHKTTAVLDRANDITMRQTLRRTQMYKGEIVGLGAGSVNYQ